jgi:hypothetical protein
MACKKGIDMKKGQKILTRLDEIPDPVLSARQFVIMNFDKLRQSGKTLKALHHFFLCNGIDVGTFESFRSAYNSVKRAEKEHSTTTSTPEKNVSTGISLL